MANLKASIKDIRRSGKRRVQNAQQRSRLRTFDKKIRTLATAGSVDEAQEMFRTYTSYLDRAGKRHLIHPAQADRRKSRMAALLSKLGAKPIASAAPAPAAVASAPASTPTATTTES